MRKKRLRCRIGAHSYQFAGWLQSGPLAFFKCRECGRRSLRDPRGYC